MLSLCEMVQNFRHSHLVRMRENMDQKKTLFTQWQKSPKVKKKILMTCIFSIKPTPLSQLNMFQCIPFQVELQIKVKMSFIYGLLHYKRNIIISYSWTCGKKCQFSMSKVSLSLTDVLWKWKVSNVINGTKYSRMGLVKFLEDNL